MKLILIENALRKIERMADELTENNSELLIEESQKLAFKNGVMSEMITKLADIIEKDIDLEIINNKLNRPAVEIVSNLSREILNQDDRKLVYIPMTESEQETFAPEVVNACFRIRFDLEA